MFEGRIYVIQLDLLRQFFALPAFFFLYVYLLESEESPHFGSLMQPHVRVEARPINMGERIEPIPGCDGPPPLLNDIIIDIFRSQLVLCSVESILIICQPTADVVSEQDRDGDAVQSYLIIHGTSPLLVGMSNKLTQSVLLSTVSLNSCIVPEISGPGCASFSGALLCFIRSREAVERNQICCQKTRGVQHTLPFHVFLQTVPVRASPAGEFGKVFFVPLPLKRRFYLYGNKEDGLALTESRANLLHESVSSRFGLRRAVGTRVHLKYSHHRLGMMKRGW